MGHTVHTHKQRNATQRNTTYDSNNGTVGHQFAAVHVRLGFVADLRAGGDRGAQHVSRRQVHDAKLFPDLFALRALARRGGAGNHNPGGGATTDARLCVEGSGPRSVQQCWYY